VTVAVNLYILSQRVLYGVTVYCLAVVSHAECLVLLFVTSWELHLITHMSCAADHSASVQCIPGGGGRPSVSAAESEPHQRPRSVPRVVFGRRDVLRRRRQHADQSSQYYRPAEHRAFIFPATVWHIIHSFMNSQCCIPAFGMFSDYAAHFRTLSFSVLRFEFICVLHGQTLSMC